MTIIEYIILGIGILTTFGWCFKIRHKVKFEQVREKGMELLGFLMTVSIILIFVFHLSPFHLLWMLPASYILGMLSITTPIRVLWIFSSIYFSFWYIGINNPGRKFYVDGEYEKAIAFFKEEINKKPSSSEAHFNLALAYGKLGEFEKEISAFETAIRLKPNQPEFHFNLGGAYIDIGNKQKALDAFNEAIRLKPEYLKAHYTVCQLYAEIGDRENAIKEFEISKKLDPTISAELESVINKYLTL